ncbi:MAG: DHA2 family efflux MFS transporter permease subunit [Akkermansiaceae bacterium]|nr:DHA2 family efflux MFS transporter permease subunit [Armatimonadota bacterium]
MAVATAKPNQVDPRLPATASANTAIDTVARYRWLILAGLWAAAVMEVLDTTIINVALPQMAGNLGATTTEIAWVSTGYILANVVILPMTAFLAERFGRKNYLMFSILLFVVASFFCGLSKSLGEIILWRILQGAGGAALLSTAQGTLRQIFPASEQGIVQAIFLLGIIIAPTLGPTLGGWITDNYTWAWCFYVNIPIGILSLFLVGSFLSDPPRKPDAVLPKADWLGISLLAAGLGSLQYVLEEGNKDEWFESALIVRLTVISVVTLAALIWWQLSPRNPSPVVNLRVLKNKQFAASLLMFMALGFGLYGGIYLFPLFAQTVIHFTPTQTGLALLPGGVATGVVVMICGALLNGKAKVDPRVLIGIGAIIFPVSMWMLSHLTTQTGEADVRLALLVRGIGLGFLFTPLNLVAFGSLKGPEIQQGAGLINLTRQMGGSFGIAVLGTYVTNMTHFHRGHLSEYVYAGNPALLERQQEHMQLLLAHGYSFAQAQGISLGLISRTVAEQAMTMAYNNSFTLIMLTFFAVSPAILLLRAPKAAAGGPPADAH